MPRYESPYDPSIDAAPTSSTSSTRRRGMSPMSRSIGPRCATPCTRTRTRRCAPAGATSASIPTSTVGIVTGSRAGLLRRTRRQIPRAIPGTGQAHAARGPEQPPVPLGRRRAAAGREPGKAADRRDQRLRGRCWTQHHPPVSTAGDGRRCLDRRPAHQRRPPRRAARDVHRAAAHDRRLPHALQRPLDRPGMSAAGDRQQGGAA